ncbi:MAG: hypothetical protein IT467_11315, partial [Dokdonella sp.]|nr:hypothetical protein [Dokdonella sp.]
MLRTCLLGLIGLAAFSPPATAATEYCVGTFGQFQAALDDAEVDIADSLIKVRAGTYTLSNDLSYATNLEYVVPAGRLTIRGGYDVGCNNYSLTPGATTLVSSNQSKLSIRTSTGSATVAGMTFQGTHLRMFSPVLSDCPSQRRTISLSRVRIDQAMFEAIGWCHDVMVE